MADDTTETAGPLMGLRVLDLWNSPAGAQATQTLADFGAEVVQVEPPAGSALRALLSFPFIARGKRAMALDLDDAGDAALARAMALGADVLVETFRPGMMERLELGYEDLAKEKGLRGVRDGPAGRTVGVRVDGGAGRPGLRLGAVLQLRGQPAAARRDLRRTTRT
jgi:hypothetical protein